MLLRIKGARGPIKFPTAAPPDSDTWVKRAAQQPIGDGDEWKRLDEGETRKGAPPD
jgi:hypothetical protein